MKHLLTLLFAVGIVTAQDNIQWPMKRLVAGGNKSVTLGQIVAGYSNYNHIGIRPPIRNGVVSLQEEIQVLESNVYPNPTFTGVVNLRTENVSSFRVSDVFGNIVYDFQNVGNINAVRTFQISNRGIYFIKMISTNDINHSTILIFQ